MEKSKKINKGYIRGFVNEKYNQKQYQELNNYCIYRKQNFEGDITDNTKTVKRILSSSLNKELNSPKQINIRLINLKYKTDDTELETLSDNKIILFLIFNSINKITLIY